MRNFTEGNIGREILLFTLPMIGANLMMLSYQFVDSIIIGIFLGKESLAAVSESYPILFGIISLMIGIGSGAMVVLSQYFGAKQFDKVQLTVDTVHVIFLVAGLSIGILGYFLSKVIFNLMGTPSEVIDDGVLYMTYYLGGIVFNFGFYVISSLMRGTGDSITPMWLYVGSAILNLILDILFIVYFHFGIASAAVATTISLGTMYCIAIIIINSRQYYFKIRPFSLKFDKGIFIQCLSYGIPTGIQQFIVAFGSIVMMSIISGFGTNVIAGYGAGYRINTIAVLPAMNFSSSLSVYTGQNIGAGKKERLKTGVLYALLYSCLFSLVATIIIQTAPYSLISLFSTDSAVTASGTEYITTVSMFYLLYSLLMILTGFLRGAGASTATAIITLITCFAAEIPIAYFLSSMFGSSWIWRATPISWMIGCILYISYTATGRWKNKSITNLQSSDIEL